MVDFFVMNLVFVFVRNSDTKIVYSGKLDGLVAT